MATWMAQAAHPSTETERRIGGRIIRAGDVVTISGLGRARVMVVGDDGELREHPGFKVVGFRGDEVFVVGAQKLGRVQHARTFKVDRIGARRRRK